MNRRLFLPIAVLALLSASSGWAQEQDTAFGGPRREFSKIGVGTGTFLSIPVGARATAMGAGFSGVADDPSAVYWNPAGISRIPGSSASYAFTSMFAGITHNFAAVTFPIGENYKGGVSALSLSSGDIEVTDMFNQEGTGATYRAEDLALGLTISGQLTDQFSFGATAKYINLSIAHTSASGIAVDFGTMYDPGILGMTIGFAVQNLSAPFSYEGTDLYDRGDVDQVSGNIDPNAEQASAELSLPLIFRSGLGFEFLEDNLDHDVKANVEFSTTSNAPEHVGVGAEYMWKKLVAARVGYQFGSPDAYGVSAGLGLIYDSGPFYATLDYAIRPHVTLGLLNTITASVRLQ